MPMVKCSPFWLGTRTTGSLKVGDLNRGDASSSGINRAAEAEKPENVTVPSLTSTSVSQVQLGMARAISSITPASGTAVRFRPLAAMICSTLRLRPSTIARNCATCRDALAMEASRSEMAPE